LATKVKIITLAPVLTGLGAFGLALGLGLLGVVVLGVRLVLLVLVVVL
jgi:hypothetical protein